MFGVVSIALGDAVVEVVDRLDGIVVAADHLLDRTVFIDDVSGDHHQHLTAGDAGVSVAEQTVEDRDLVDHGQRGETVIFLLVDESADDHSLTVGDGHIGFDYALVDFRRVDGLAGGILGGGGDLLLDLDGDEVGAGDLRSDRQDNTGVEVLVVLLYRTAAGGVGDTAGNDRDLFTDSDRSLGVAGNQKLRT